MDQDTVTLPEMCPHSVSPFDDGPLVCQGSSQSGMHVVVNLPTKAVSPPHTLSVWVWVPN